MAAGLEGRAAPMSARNEPEPPDRSDLMSIRHTVGGAQNVVTSCSRSCRSSVCGSKRAYLRTTIVASATHGAKKHDHACLAQPAEEMLRCTSPGRTPSQYIVERAPTG